MREYLVLLAVLQVLPQLWQLLLQLWDAGKHRRSTKSTTFFLLSVSTQKTLIYNM